MQAPAFASTTPSVPTKSQSVKGGEVGGAVDCISYTIGYKSDGPVTSHLI